MKLFNTATDLATINVADEQEVAHHRLFLGNLLGDYTVFNDAVYPEGYDITLQEGDSGYIAPVIRQEWNAGAAATWGYESRDAVQAALDEFNAAIQAAIDAAAAAALLDNDTTEPDGGEV
jgi:hypothetical protein